MQILMIALVYVVLTAVVGCAWGLIPFFVGRYRFRPNAGRWGLIWCGVAGPFVLSFFVALGFVIFILTGERDMRPPRRMSASGQPVSQSTVSGQPVSQPPYYETPAQGSLTLTCLAGPLKGQSYPVGREGLIFGRDMDCTVHFPAETGGISRHHCAIRWQQGVPVLVDLGSAYGTFLGDGKQLPRNYPAAIGPGTRFYLATPANLFQISII